jgi:hypothetical protein
MSAPPTRSTPAPPVTEKAAEKEVPTTTTVSTPVGSASATASLPAWLSGTYMMFYLILFFVWLAAYYFGAAKISYDQTGSGLYAFVAFLFAPIYYPYYAFFVSKPASAPMLGGGKGGIAGTIRSVAKGIGNVADAVLRSVPKRV